MQFDREKTPERVVHARGITAKGVFEVRQEESGNSSCGLTHCPLESIILGV